MEWSRRCLTLIELLVVIAILGILASLLLPALGRARLDAQVAVARGELRGLEAALEAYNSDEGFYPRDPGSVFGADIPHYLFAALNNKPTARLGGGRSMPYFDGRVGLRSAAPDFRAVIEAGGAARPVNFADAAEVLPKAAPLGPEDNRASAAFQGRFDYAAAPVGLHLDGIAGYPVFVDPWGNPYHYRVWQGKRGDRKEVWAGPGRPQDRRCWSPERFDVWSDGPDGVNNHGAAGSDDVANWRGR